MILLSLSACTSAAVPAGDAGNADTGTVRNDASTDGSTLDSNVQDAAPADAGPASPPTLTSVTLQTHGTMSLTWDNPSSGCTTLELNRKKDSGTYALATMLTGVATSTLDMPGHASGTYCYTLVCVRGGSRSDPSNEMCATQ